MEPRACRNCLGSGRSYADNDPLAEHDLVECPQCNGTGKVWASVKEEVVATMESTGNNTGKVTFAAMAMAALDEPAPVGRYRVIVQPMKEGE